MSKLSLDLFDLLTLFFSWYIKPILISKNIFLFLQFSILLFFLSFIKLFVNFYLHIFYPILHCFSTIKVTSLFSIFMALKFVALIFLLIVIRGAIPRYRYDFLTKLGWIKTLSLVLAMFLINLLLSYL
jgi:NADH:ubiquinone oxidoreductase subunit H